jgi:serine/threonine protein kinase
LRDLHDSGKVHGWLTPSAVAISGGRIEVLISPATPEGARNFTAPEVLAGEPADVRSDVFSLGAVLCAMLIGTKNFESESSLRVAAAPPAINHFLTQCMAHDPAARPQRMQKVLLELKFLMITARRAEAQSATAMMREVVHTLETVSQRLVAAEQEIGELRRYAASVEEKVATSLQSHEKALHAHALAIESAQSSTAQTDNLVERVVDALDLLQSTLIDQASVGQPGSN